jgi:hypothetical protein
LVALSIGREPTRSSWASPSLKGEGDFTCQACGAELVGPFFPNVKKRFIWKKKVPLEKI